jgi:hypothetical protein
VTDPAPPTEPTRPVVAKKVDAPVSGTATVSVGCKLPSGLILRRFEWHEETELGPIGSRTVRVSRPVAGSEFHIKGNAELNHMPAGMIDRFGANLFPGGFAVTEGVPADLWSAWHEVMRDSQMCREGLIFALADPAEAAAEARTRASLRSGFEAIDPDDHQAKTGIRASRINPMGGTSTVERGVTE